MVNLDPKWKSWYNRTFPLSTFGRFLLDECLKFIFNLLYYTTLAIGISIIVCIISFMSFQIGDYFFNLETYRNSRIESLMLGFLFAFFTCLFMAIVIGTIVGLYEFDYLNWVESKKQEKDIESLVENNQDKCQSIFLTLFPYYSIRRYLLIRISLLTVIILVSSLYIYFCYNIVIYFFGYDWAYTKNSITGKLEQIPFTVMIFICFLFVSLILGVCVGVIGLFGLACMDSWKKYKIGSRQVQAKEN